MKKFEGFCLFSDVDGTLADANFCIPQRNIDAIRYFVENGGRFALATGRGLHPKTLSLMAQLAINMPCVMLNGALLYDMQSKTALQTHPLPQREVRELAAKLVEKFPDHSIILWCDGCHAQLGVNRMNMLNFDVRPLESVTEPVLKLVVSNDEGAQQEMVDFIASNMSGGAYTTTSSPRFVELMPQGVSKAKGIEELIDRLGLERKKVIVMGDYYNDREMLSMPGVRAFCPQNAPDDIKALCERSFCNVDDGAVADAIGFLEKELG